MKAKTPLNLQVSLRWHDLKVSLNVYLWALGIIVLVKSNELVKNIETKQL